MVLSDFTRKQAFLTHLLASACIFIVISYIIIFHWYPQFYFFLDGGERAIATIFFVDVVLGPGLTLLVFKPGKKSLKFDMSVILLLQLSALAWGLNSVYTERSGLAIYYLGKLACVSHSESAAYDMEAISAGPSGKQRLALLQRPDSLEDFYEFTKKAYEGGEGEIYYHSKKVAPLATGNLDRLDKYELDMAKLKDNSEPDAAVIDAYLKNHPGYNETYKLIPLVCRYGKALAIYDKHELKITNTLEMQTILPVKDPGFESMPGKPVQVIAQEN